MLTDSLSWSFAHPSLVQDAGVLTAIPTMEFRFASAYLNIPIYPLDVCYACFRVSGHFAVKLGVSTNTNEIYAFSDVETGWSLFLKKGELRHASGTEGQQTFAIPQRPELDIIIKVDRSQGTLEFLLLGDVISRCGVIDPVFLSPEPMYFAVALYIGGLVSFCRPLWVHSYWEERKTALFVFARGLDTILQRMPEELSRCAVEYL